MFNSSVVCKNVKDKSLLMHASSLAVEHEFLSSKARVQFLFSAGQVNNRNRFKGLLCLKRSALLHLKQNRLYFTITGG